MNMKILALGAAILVVFAGFFILLGAGDDGGDSGMNGTATICVQEVGKAETYTAEYDLSEPDIGEQMMLSFGQGIRGKDLALQSTPGDPGDDPGDGDDLSGVIKLGKYRVWAKATVSVTGTNIPSATLTASQVKFSATSGSGNACYYTSSSSTANVIVTNPLKYGQTVTVDQSTVGKWLYVNSGGTPTNLLGQDLDGMVLRVYITASAVDQNGVTVNAATSATLTLHVTSWAAGGTLSAVVTSIDAGGPEFFSMIDADISMSCMEMARMEA